VGNEGSSTPVTGDVTRPLARPGLLQQVRLDPRSTDSVGLVEVDLDKLSEPAAVVVPERLGVPKGFQHGVGLEGGSVRRFRESSSPTLCHSPPSPPPSSRGCHSHLQDLILHTSVIRTSRT